MNANLPNIHNVIEFLKNGFILWSCFITIKFDLFFLAYFFSISITIVQFSSSKFEVGSSAKITFGLWITDNAILKRCNCPSLNFRILRFLSSRSTNSLNNSLIALVLIFFLLKKRRAFKFSKTLSECTAWFFWNTRPIFCPLKVSNLF